MAQKGVRFVFNPQQLRGLYVEQGLSQVEIARILGVSQSAVSVYLVRLGIKARPAHREARPIPEEALRDLYVRQELSAEAVAKVFKVSPPTVIENLRQYGIEVRRPTAKFNYDAAELRRLYVDEGMTQEQIAERWGVHQVSVGDWLRQSGIRTRPKGVKTHVILPEEELRRLYIDEKMDAHDLRRHFGCGMGTVTANLRRYGFLRTKEERIALRSEKASRNNRAPFLSGEREYKSFMSNTGYRMEYDPDSMKYRGEHCFVCEKALGRTLKDNENVHHINFRRDDNRIENLAVMTQADHVRFHGYIGRLWAYERYIDAVNPGGLAFYNPVFWAGQWIDSIDLSQERDLLDRRAALEAAEKEEQGKVPPPETIN